jgi:CBS domain containing-hemolysin-like protein
VFALDAETTARDAYGQKALTKHSRVPVFDQDPDDVVGIVHQVDVLTAVAEDRFDVPLESFMRPIHFVVDTMPLDQLLQSFLERQAHMAAVIDEFGGFAGITTLEDVLEELIGREIVDESDQITDMRELARRHRDTIMKRGG